MSYGDGFPHEPGLPEGARTGGGLQTHPSKSARRRAYLAVGLSLILAGIVVIVGLGWVKYRRVRTCAESTLVGLSALQELAPSGSVEPPDLDLAEIGVQLRGLGDGLACLRAEGGEFLALAPLLGWLPKVGNDAASAPDLLEMAEALVNSGVLVSDAMAPLVERMGERGSTEQTGGEDSLDLAQAVLALEEAQPALASAEAELDRAWELQLELEDQALSPRLERVLDLTGRYLPLLRTGVRAAQLAPRLMGADGPRRYLILAQNDDERRPTGGWISGLGLVTVQQGRVADVSFSDSWAVDNLQVPHEIPPESMFRTLWAEIWLFRDANWSPDFPSSAQVAESILQRDQGVTVDGVIAVNQHALQLLVGALAPLDVESSDEPVSASNVLTFVRDAWAEPEAGGTPAGGWGEWETHRKDFMSDLVDAVLRKVQDQREAVDLSQLARSLWQGLQERHILVYLHDEEAGALLASQRWDGGIVTAPGDYLQVVDANVGFNKVDPNVERAIVYQVDLTDPAQPRGQVSVLYQNQSSPEEGPCIQEVVWEPSYVDRMEGCYWDYVRFYVPQGSRLDEAERETLPAGSLLSRNHFAPLEDAGPKVEPEEGDKSAFGLFFDLAPGQEREVRLAWQLPAETVQSTDGKWRYRLLVQKQSGSLAIPLRVEITLPPGSRIVATSPEPVSVQKNVLIFELQLDEDQIIEVLFQDGSQAHSSEGQERATRLSEGRRPC